MHGGNSVKYYVKFLTLRSLEAATLILFVDIIGCNRPVLL
jgi:hypothetical protein